MLPCCDDDSRLMYWAVEADAIVDFLDFDDGCRADMIAAGGKG